MKMFSGYGTAELELFKEQERQSQSKLMRIFMCFSLLRNIKLLFSGESKVTDIKPFNGIRAIAIFCIIWTNSTRLELIHGASTEESILPGLKENLFSYSVLLSTSATLNAYQNMESIYESKFNIFKYISRRLLRILPPYWLTLLFLIGILNNIEDAPPHKKEMIKVCQEDGWQNVFLVNNFFGEDRWKVCLPTSWYIAVNFQFWIFTPAILYALFRYPKLTLAIVTTCSVFQQIGLITIVVSFQDFNLLTYYAYQSYVICFSWGFGMVAGFLICNQKVPGIGKKTQCSLWVTSFVLSVIGPVLAITRVISLETFQEVLFVISPLPFTIFLTYLGAGYGGIINDALSHPIWLLFSKTSYTALLVHWVLMVWFIAPPHSDEFLAAVNSVFTSLGCYIFTSVPALIIEIPFRELLKELWTRQRFICLNLFQAKIDLNRNSWKRLCTH